MSELNENYERQLAELAVELVNPERFGKVALAPVIQFPLPELARIYDFPTGEAG